MFVNVFTHNKKSDPYQILSSIFMKILTSDKKFPCVVS